MKLNEPCDMKPNIRRLLALATLSALVALSPCALAQAQPKDGAKAKGAAQSGARRDRLQALAQELQLTDEQKNQLRPVLKQEADKLKALREDTSLSTQDRRAKTKEIRNTVSAKMKKVLTTEQWDKYQSLQAERRKGAAKPAGGKKPKA
jgi:Spy/CpxP family protein refolding chaperone